MDRDFSTSDGAPRDDKRQVRRLFGHSVLPANSARAVVPDDAVDLDEICTALHAATPGIVRVTTKSGETVNVFIPEGGVVPLRVRRVWQSGTTATGIVAFY